MSQSSGPPSSSQSSPKCTCFIVSKPNNKVMHEYCFKWTAVSEWRLDGLAVRQTVLQLNLYKMNFPGPSKHPWAKHWIAFSLFALCMRTSVRWLLWDIWDMATKEGWWYVVQSNVFTVHWGWQWNVYVSSLCLRFLLDGNANKTDREQQNTKINWGIESETDGMLQLRKQTEPED